MLLDFLLGRQSTRRCWSPTSTHRNGHCIGPVANERGSLRCGILWYPGEALARSGGTPREYPEPDQQMLSSVGMCDTTSRLS